jgi:MFS family permease
MRLLYTGLLTSMVGDSLMLLVFGIWVKSLTGSNSAAGLVLLCLVGPCALSPAYGWLVDRVRRRPFLAWTNVLSALMLLPLLAVRNRADVWIIFAVAG